MRDKQKEYVLPVLDDLKMIHSRDSEDALGLNAGQWKYLKHDFGVKLEITSQINNVVLSGMGGSALPGVFIASWPGVNVPFEISRNYNIPKFVSDKTLFIASSYSGNTEESNAALAEAEKAGAQIVVIAAGGKLAEQAKEKNYPYYTIPDGMQPRFATFYFIAGFVDILEQLGLVAKGSQAELHKTADWLGEKIESWQPDVPEKQNYAKQLALELIGKSIVVYAGPKLFPAANKWKICFNENAKNIAWCNQFPELNHNEFLGWTSHPVEKPYAVVELRSKLEHPRVLKRFEVTDKLLSGKRPAPEVVDVEGETLAEQLLWAANLGDFVSLYVALLNGIDPTPVALIEKLKIELGK